MAAFVANDALMYYAPKDMWAQVRTSYSNHDELCSRRDELCSRRDELCIRNDGDSSQNQMHAPPELCIRNDGSCINNDELCI